MTSDPILAIRGLGKTYPARANTPATTALDGVDLEIRRGEIFALLGPNGAGKTTLIGAVCGLVRPGSGTIHAFGLDMARDWRAARARIGLVPQELSVDMFEPVLLSVSHSRGLFGLAPDPARIEQILRALSLWDKRGARIGELSGGMKRRVLIAKALAHDPALLFLDEPTAGVDVELRRDMWQLIGQLRDQGVTIVLTTHYIEEAEEMADRVGVIHRGKLIVVEEKAALMARLGRTEVRVGLAEPLGAIPAALAPFPVQVGDDRLTLILRTTGAQGHERTIASLVKALVGADIAFTALDVHQSSLEDIFVELVGRKAG
ncbi:ABC transporter ATP-binding protein [Novosphingobium bradum]|uniref:ABC transporter ATP-binding protein n=1 Tax=Novosphingobium bradum TaxID=1737444 RepID=A0ABV7IM37_9SPHN